MLPPPTPLLLPLAAVAPGTPVRTVGDAARYADALAALGLVLTDDGAAPWAVAWRTLDGLDDPAARALRDALVPGGWIVVAVASEAPPDALAAAMEAAGLALAVAPVADADADGVPILHGLFRRVEPGVIG